MEEDKVIKGQPKSFLKKIKENVDDHDEQMAILGAIVRLGVVVWSGFIITLNYVELPMVKKPVGTSSDITFVASIFTGALATFGLSTGRTKGEKTNNQNHEKIIVAMLLLPAGAYANVVTPQFTTGSMNSTTTTTQTITEVEQRQVLGLK